MNMELGLGNTLLAGDPRLVDHIVGEVKSQGIFDQFRKECIADVDTKPAYQNLRTRVESSVNSFLNKQTWKADLNKNQLRETLRKHIHDAPYLDAGVERIVDQVVNPKVYSVFMPQIEDVVYKFLGIERPKDRQRNGPCGFKDLLPIDLDPVSPESDKNSLKDVSLDSVDAQQPVEEPTPEEPTKSRDTTSTSLDQNRKDDEEIEKNPGRNGHANEDTTSQDVPPKPSSVPPSSGSNLNSSSRSEEKLDEEEEDSPMFEPIDIMNFNESHVSNDSHLSGISELTSHRSRSPDFSNDGSRENMDFSNHDSEFSKVSSDSRLSIVTDFGSSNHDSTNFSEAAKDDREKNDSRPKDNFRAVREFESVKGTNKDGRIYDSSGNKESVTSDSKSIRRSFSSKETSRDGMELAVKDARDVKDKVKNEASKSRTSRDKDSRKDRDKDSFKKQQNSHLDPKMEKSSGKSKTKDNREASRSSLDKNKEKESTTKAKESNAAKEVKDLKDMYKEKIRELREKKKDSDKIVKEKDTKLAKDSKDKRDSSREKKDVKDHKITTSKSSSRDGKNLKIVDKDTKISKSDSRDKGKRDERRSSKEHRSRSSNADEKIDGKRLSRSEKDEKTDKTESKQKSLVQKKDSGGKNSDGKRDSKGELESKDKKRRDEKKAKTKDDHSSMRKNSDDRRSTDRDGSNGSNGKNSQKSSSSLGASSGKPVTSSLSKESTNPTNSSSETSDSIEESQNDKLRLSTDDKNCQDKEINYRDFDSQAKRLDVGQGEISLPIKKRPLPGDDNGKGEITIKKPKYARNLQEAKKLMKIRRKMEKEQIKQQQQQSEFLQNVETVSNSPAEVSAAKVDNDILSVPDEERVQIIEVRDEEYDEPYPEMKSDFTLEERSQIILGGESIFTSDFSMRQLNAKSTLSVMELSIRQSLQEMISDNKIEETCQSNNSQNSVKPEADVSNAEPVDRRETESSSSKLGSGEDPSECPLTSKDSSEVDKSDEAKLSASSEQINKNEMKINDDESCEKDVKNADIVRKSEAIEGSEKMEIVETLKEQAAQPEEESKPEIGKDKMKVEAPKSEEKLPFVIVGDEEQVEGPNSEEKSKSVFTVDGEKGEISNYDEKSEVIIKRENVETPNPDENSRPEIIGNPKTIETPRFEKESQSESVKNKERIDAQNSEDKSTSEIDKMQEKDEERKSEENTIPETTEEQESIEARKSVEKSTFEIDKQPDEADARKSAETSTLESAEKPKEVKAQNVKERSTQEIVDTLEEVESPNCEEESIQKIVENQKTPRASKSMEKSTLEIDKEKKEAETVKSEEKSILKNGNDKEKVKPLKSEEISTPEVGEEKEKVETLKSEDKSTPKIGKEEENVETLKSEEQSMPKIGTEETNIEYQQSEEIVDERTEETETPISGPSEPQPLAHPARGHENATKSCNTEKISSEKGASSRIDENMPCQSDDEPCLYFTVDNDRLDRFTKFMKSLEIAECSSNYSVVEDEIDETTSNEKIASTVSKTMAPPLPKRKFSTSPLTDILLNNRNNNNDADKITASISDVDESSSNTIKKRKIGRPRKEKPNLTLCSQQNLLNGENFVMPLSPESDVSATSEKAPSNPIKDEKSRVAVRGSNQRYTSDDLYKPRPLFASSSRRSRRSNQA